MLVAPKLTVIELNLPCTLLVIATRITPCSEQHTGVTGCISKIQS